MIAVDAVYTWVNGADPQHHAKRALYRWGGARGRVTPGRWRDNGELKYSLRALHKYAPWIRRIFIVTDNQVPDWLDTSHPQIEIVDHKTIFPNQSHLPTFNSCVIEAFLHRIPGLSAHFLYFNDDVFLGREVTLDDFLTPSGQQILHIERPLPNLRQLASGRLNQHGRLMAYCRLLLLSLGRCAPLAGVPHTPQFFVKADVEAVVKRFEWAIKFGMPQRFRGWRMPPLRVLYVNTLLNAGGHVGRVLSDDEYQFLMLNDNGGGHRELAGLMQAARKFFCINDNRQDPATQPQLIAMLDMCLRRNLPTPSPFERLPAASLMPRDPDKT